MDEQTSKKKTARPAVKAIPKGETISVSEAARILKGKSSWKRARKQAAAVMSEAGARKGGQARARNLSPERIKEIARLGGLARQRKARERQLSVGGSKLAEGTGKSTL